MRTFRYAVPVVLQLVLVSCSETTKPSNEPAEVVSITLANATPLRGVVGELTDTPPTVLVKRQSDGTPLPGVVLVFDIGLRGQGGSVTARYDTTDALGIASPGTWRLGQRVGLQQLDVVALQRPASTTLTATARAGAPDRIQIATTLEQYVLGGREPIAPSVTVRDRYFNPIDGVDVTFSASQGGGLLGLTTTKTNSNGYASAVTWKISQAAAQYSVKATVLTRTFDFTALRVDSSTLVWYTLDSLIEATRTVLPAIWNIKAARLGLSPFDPCFCVNLDGVFFEITDFVSGSQGFEFSGPFTISNGNVATSAAETVNVRGTSVLLKRRDYYYPIYTTYVYNRKN